MEQKKIVNNLNKIEELLIENLAHKTVFMEIITQNDTLVTGCYIKNLLINFDTYNNVKKLMITDIHKNTGMDLAIKFENIELNFQNAEFNFITDYINIKMDDTILNIKVFKLKKQSKFNKLVQILKGNFSININ